MSDALKPKPVEDQPPPKRGFDEVWPVLERRFRFMLPERVAEGIRRYGTPLQTFNGRDAFRDAMEEWFDLGLYVTQMWLEQETLQNELIYILVDLLDGLDNNNIAGIKRGVEELERLVNTWEPVRMGPSKEHNDE
jgi:hypothetical protein